VTAAERRAAQHYRLRGYRILAVNAWAGGNEVDVIARRGRTLVFCEVKDRRRDDYGAPAEFVHPEKQRRVRRAAEAWLAARPELAGLDVRFDVVAVAAGRLKRITGAF
jgi:putative endonuclease